MPESVSAKEYESRIRQAAQAGEPAPDVEPPEDYVMSDDFQQWLVARMRDDVLGQVSDAGLDRMAILKPRNDDE